MGKAFPSLAGRMAGRSWSLGTCQTSPLSPAEREPMSGPHTASQVGTARQAPRGLPQRRASPAVHHVELPRAVCRCSRTHSGTRERNSGSACGPPLPAGSLISSGPEVHVGQSRESAIPSWDRRPSQNGSIPFDDTLSRFSETTHQHCRSCSRSAHTGDHCDPCHTHAP